MNKQILITSLLIIISSSLIGQTDFILGSYTSNSGQEFVGLISPNSVKETPQSFQFKSSEESEPITLTKNNATSVSITDEIEKLKYVLKPVLTYESNDNINKLDNTREASFKKEDLFIELLVGSDVSLYRVKRINKKNIFFYSDSEEKITTLVQKKYIGFNNQIKSNNDFRQQLSTALNCTNEKNLSFENIEYNAKSLLNLFQNYQECSNSSSSFIRKKNKDKLLNVKASVGAGTASFNTETRGGDVDFGKSNYVSFGGEVEYLTSTKRKWGLVLNLATYNFSELGFNDVQLNFPSTETITIENGAEVKGLDLNLGIRHYIHLSDASAIFIGGFFGFDLINSTEIVFLNINRESISTTQGAPNFAVGLGYQWNKLSAEFKLHSPKNHLNEGTFFSNSSLNYSSIALRYELFNF